MARKYDDDVMDEFAKIERMISAQVKENNTNIKIFNFLSIKRQNAENGSDFIRSLLPA